MYTCDSCRVWACSKENGREKMPENCPMHQEVRFESGMEDYFDPENHKFYVEASSIEGRGYCQWTRLKETVELCKSMGYQKIGLAFCKGLSREAAVVARIFREHGFTVTSVICKAGNVPKEWAKIPKEGKISGDNYEAMCNPIMQAKLLNDEKTDFNIVLGLCVGHDSMFYKYSEALVTTLVVKDRVLAHNPVGAIYCAEGYYKDKL